jgi:hypothetical protein
MEYTASIVSASTVREKVLGSLGHGFTKHLEFDVAEICV